MTYQYANEVAVKCLLLSFLRAAGKSKCRGEEGAAEEAGGADQGGGISEGDNGDDQRREGEDQGARPRDCRHGVEHDDEHS